MKINWKHVSQAGNFCKKYIFIVMGTFVLLTCFSFAYSISENSWQGQMFVNLEAPEQIFSSSKNVVKIEEIFPPNRDSRGLANLEHIVPGALIAEERITQDTQKLFLQASKIINQEGMIQLYLGHFLVQLKNGQSILACQEYDTIDLVFEAQGVSIHGHTPKMILKSKCDFDLGSPLQMGPFLIPAKRILASHAGQELFRDRQSTLMFSDVAVHWPNEWVLMEMRFINQKTQKDFTVSLFPSNQQEDLFILSLR